MPREGCVWISVWISVDQCVECVYNSLSGVHRDREEGKAWAKMLSESWGDCDG